MKKRDITIIAIGLYIILAATLIGILVFTPTNNYDINKDGKVDTPKEHFTMMLKMALGSKNDN